MPENVTQMHNKYDISESEIEKRLVPVIIGGDLLAYSYVREFNRRYNIERCILIMGQDVKVTTTSRFTDCRIVPDYKDYAVLLQTFLDIATELKSQDEKLIPLALGTDDPHALFLSKYSDELANAGYIFCANDYELVSEICQKKVFYDMCDELDIPHAKCTYIRATKDEDFSAKDNPYGYPVILKPSDCSEFQRATIKGKRKIYIIDDDAELAEVWTNLLNSDFNGYMVLQDFIPGGDDTIASLTTFSDENGDVKIVSGGRVCLQDHCPTAIGNPVCILGEKNDKAIACAKKIVKHLRYKGFANFDLKYDCRTNEYSFLEVNIRAGRNSYYISLSGTCFIEPIVEQFVLHKTLEYKESYDPFIYSCVPKYVIKRSVEDSQLKQKIFATFRKMKLSPYPLYYKNDSAIHNFWAFVMRTNQIRKFKKYMWDTQGKQLKD